MKINYYLQKTKVKRAEFKTFSSKCTRWIQIIDIHMIDKEYPEEEISLIYDPASNSVLVNCTKDELFRRLTVSFKEQVRPEEMGRKKLEEIINSGARQNALH